MAEACGGCSAAAAARATGPGGRGAARLLGAAPAGRPGAAARRARRQRRRGRRRRPRAEDPSWRTPCTRSTGRSRSPGACGCARPGSPRGPALLDVEIDPGMAFGTAQHATTRACLELLWPGSPREGPLLDAGCGSGVLADRRPPPRVRPRVGARLRPAGGARRPSPTRARNGVGLRVGAPHDRRRPPARLRHSCMANLTGTVLRLLAAALPAPAPRAPDRLGHAPGGGRRRSRPRSPARPGDGASGSRTRAGRPCCWSAREAHLPLRRRRPSRPRATSSRSRAEDAHHLARVVRRRAGRSRRADRPRRARSGAVVVGARAARRRCASTGEGQRPAAAARRALPGARRVGAPRHGGREGRRAGRRAARPVRLRARAPARARRRRLGAPPRAPRPRVAEAAARQAGRRRGGTACGGCYRSSDRGRDPGRGGLPDRPTRRGTASDRPRRTAGRPHASRWSSALRRASPTPRSIGRVRAGWPSAGWAPRSCAPRPPRSRPWPSRPRRPGRGAPEHRLPVLPHRRRGDPGHHRAPGRPLPGLPRHRSEGAGPPAGHPGAPRPVDRGR